MFCNYSHYFVFCKSLRVIVNNPFVFLSELQTPHDGAIMSIYGGTFTFKPTGECQFSFEDQDANNRMHAGSQR